MREFTTAVERAEGEEAPEEEVWEFSVDGFPCTAYRPNEGQLAVLMATSAAHSSTEEQVAGAINFFVAVLDDSSHAYIVNRLLDRKNPMPLIGDPEKGTTGVRDIMNWLIEEWSGRPTVSPSGSTRSRASTGSRSTAGAPALT